MAASSIQNLGKIPELRKRILFTLAMLAIYRIGVFVTVPGVNRVEMENVISKGGSGSFLGMFNMFSGGALEQLSIFALGIMPYVSASIVVQLLTVVVPKLDQLNKEGEQGRRRINQITRYGTILLATVQGYFIAQYLESLSGGGSEVVVDPGLAFRVITVITLTTGTAFIMWLGEPITERGIGNGTSMIIFAGIVAGMPDALTQYIARGGSGGTVAASASGRSSWSCSRSAPSPRSASSSARIERYPCSTRSGRSGESSTRARSRSCRSRSTSLASSRRSSPRRS